MLQITEQVRDETVNYIKKCPTPMDCSIQGALNLIQHLLSLPEDKDVKVDKKTTKNKKKQNKSEKVLEKNG